MVVVDEADVGWYKGALRGRGRHVSSSKAPLTMVCQGGFNEGRGREDRRKIGVREACHTSGRSRRHVYGLFGKSRRSGGSPWAVRLGKATSSTSFGNTKC